MKIDKSQVKIRIAERIDIAIKGKNSNTLSTVDEANPISKGVPLTSLRRYALNGSPPAAPGVTLFPNKLAKSMTNKLLKRGDSSIRSSIIFHLKVHNNIIPASSTKLKAKSHKLVRSRTNKTSSKPATTVNAKTSIAAAIKEMIICFLCSLINSRTSTFSISFSLEDIKTPIN